MTIAYGFGTYAAPNLVTITGNITDIPPQVQIGMTNQGYTTARAPKLDNLDASVQEAINTARLALALSA